MRNKLSKLWQDSVKGGRPLQTINKSPPEAFTRRIWLHYFNDTLRAKGLLSEKEWREMRQLIEQS